MSPSRKKMWLTAACGVALLLFTAWALRPPTALRVEYRGGGQRGVPVDKGEAVKQMFDGTAGIDTIRLAEKIEAYRIGSPDLSTGEEHRIADFPILSGPVRVSNAVASKVAAALLSPESYGWEWVKGCEPRYGVCLSFYRNRDRIDVFLCFECSLLLVSHNGVACGGEDFDYIHGSLARAAKALFPSDSVIQALSEEACGKPKLGR